MINEITYIPKFPLSQFVDLIWVGKSNNLVLQANHHAALFTELIFKYRGSFQIDGQNVESVISKSGHRLISGLKTEPFQTTVSGEYGSIGLLLKPFCYGLLIKKFGSNSMNKISDILYETVFLPEKPDFEIAETQLIKLFEHSQIVGDLVKFENHISSEILRKGALKNFNLSLSITQKSFIQKFKKHYLLTPGQYVKLKQVNYAIQLMKQTKSNKLTDIALESGFYDQSHFIKVFKKFCGKTPKEFKTVMKNR